MIADANTNSCDICNCKAFNACMSRVDECNIVDGAKNEYAALDAMISFGKLPFFDSYKLKSVKPSSQLSCIDVSIRTQSSLLAVLGTYSNFSNIVHMGCPKNTSPNSLLEMSAAVQEDKQKGTGVCVVAFNQSGSKKYRITRHGSPVNYIVDNKELVKILHVILEGGNSICWYWDCELEPYIPVLHGADKNMWVTLNHGGQPKCLEYVCVGGSRVMQSFYSHFNNRDTLTINTGPGLVSMYARRSDESLVFSVIHDCINGVSKDGKCYFCSYVSSVHSQKHTGAKSKAALGTFKLSHALEEILDS